MERKQVKNLKVGDCVIFKDKLWVVRSHKVQKEEGEIQYSYNHHDKKEVAFSSKGKKRIVTRLECPRTGESYIAIHKPKDTVKMADKAIVDVLYRPLRSDREASGNLVAGDAIIVEDWDDNDT